MIKFEDFEAPLIKLLDCFEQEEYRNTGMSRMSGGFATAEYDYFDEDDDEENPCVYFTLTWGIQSDCEDRVYKEHYKISVEDLISEGDLRNQLKFIQSG